MSDLPAINKRHRYLIRKNGQKGYISSTDDLGQYLPPGFSMIDTIGTDGLGTMRGNKGIPDFLRAAKRGVQP